MKAFRIIFVFVIALVLLYHRLGSVSSSQESVTAPAWSQTGNAFNPDPAIPPKVFQVLQIVRTTGQAPDGYVGGRVFQNREGRLPAEGDYREFDVDPHQGGRNAERLIVEWNTKKAWYTADHYQTFLPVP